MEKLKTCVITAVDPYIRDIQSLYESGKEDPDDSIFVCVENEDVRFLSLSSPESEEYFLNHKGNLLIIEDNWQIVVIITQAMLACPGIEHVVVATSADAADALLKLWQEGPAVLTLDFRLTEDNDWPQRTEQLYRNIKKQWPVTSVISITAWESDAESQPFPESAGLVELIRGNGDDVIPKDVAILDNIIPPLVRNALAKYRIRALRKQLKVTTEIAHSDYELLPYTRKLKGIDDTLLSVARAVEPFFVWWKKKQEDSRPEFLKQDRFVTGLLFEGETGVGKSAICEAIALAFAASEKDVDMPLSKALGPGKHPGDWKEELRKEIRRLYLKAKDRRVVVVRADDLVWPALDLEETDTTASEWKRYLHTVRDYIKAAAQINKEGHTSTESLSGISYEGKILWLFARNTDEVAGRMYEPLKDLLEVIPVEFPKNLEERAEILKIYAILAFKKWSSDLKECTFAPDALDKIVSETRDYKPRDLIGDEKQATKGFLSFAIDAVKKREGARWSQHEQMKEVDLMITIDIVNDWLNTPTHRYIKGQATKNSASDSHQPEEADVPAAITPLGTSTPSRLDLERAKAEGIYGKDLKRLCEIEEAMRRRGTTAATLVELANELTEMKKIDDSIGGTSHASISQFLSIKNKTKLEEMARLWPDACKLLKQSSHWP